MRWWERVSAWDEEHRLAVDALTAAGLLLVVVPASAGMLGVLDQRPVAIASGVVMSVAVAWRRVRPALSAAVVFTAALVHLLLGLFVVFPADLLVLLALYSVTVHGPVWAYRTAFGGTIVGAGLVGLVLVADLGPFVQDVTAAAIVSFIVLLTSSTVFAYGLVRRARRQSIDALVDRAARLEVERDQQAQIATAAERARIAREMHDIVAHSLSVIIAQADGGRYAAEQDPTAAQRSLTTIAETGRAALGDMRRLLGVLRSGADAPGSVASPDRRPELAPQPGVDDIAHLVRQVRASGADVSLARLGTPRPLPPGTGLTVYRIAQESLTNVLKHAGPDVTVTVLLQWREGSLVLEVTDDGRGAAAATDGAGQGVVGMRERAAMLSGTLAVGPRPGGGYRVRAEIPVPARQEASA
ncbi:histidine kinase [Actinotalea ferrariae CF5-4]|uniref:histidine kinase n=1 Tax=Actinotalea ferrariae CF5-4 TaxID=948458 RepID=A0A021VN31_9CELL|nr:histidine kinase [Actinotalea ferrariae]EYR62513.1 histidine kinase [Actinotalea ferrariae CF5-4]